MKNVINMDWFRAAIVRAIRTIAQTALSMFSIGAAVSEVEWFHILSVSAVAGIFSLLTSLSTSLPEVHSDGTLDIDTKGEVDIYKLNLNDDLPQLATKEFIHLKVNPNADLPSQE